MSLMVRNGFKFETQQSFITWPWMSYLAVVVLCITLLLSILGSFEEISWAKPSSIPVTDSLSVPDLLLHPS